MKRFRIFLPLLCLVCLGLRAEAASVALTFDDGPSPLTKELLAILDQENVPATFFLNGYRIEEYPDACALLRGTRHELAIHGYSHGYMHRMTAEELTEEIASTRLLIMEATGKDPVLLRPPGGLSCCGVTEEAARQGLPIILWSVDPEDWRRGNTAKYVTDFVLSETHGGDVILLHDLDRRTVEALPEIICGLRERGFAFRTVSGLAAEAGVALLPGVSYCRISSKAP